MIRHAQIIADNAGVIEVFEDLVGGGRQFSYYRRDGKFLGSRIEALPLVQDNEERANPQVPDRR